MSLKNVAAIIAASGRPNPSKEYEGKTWRCIARKVHGYKNLEPNKKYQRSLPTSVYRYILQFLSNTSWIQVIYQLLGVGLFFTTISYEYTLSGSNDSDRGNIIVCAYNIQLFKHDIKLLPIFHILHLGD